MHIGCYLLSTQDKGMPYTPDSTKGIAVYVDADFAGGWEQCLLELDTLFDTLAVPFIGKANFNLRLLCPLLKPGILHAMTNLMKEINVIFTLYLPMPWFIVKVQEDNHSCIAMANNAKFSP